MKDFKGKVAVITGAASGIGYGLAERAAKESMKVVLAGINEDTLKKAEYEIKKTGTTTLVVKTDVSKAEDVKNLAEKTLDAFGAVHLLFNNAGVGVGIGKTIWENTLAEWKWLLNVNLWGVIHGLHVFLPIMVNQNEEGHIVNTASIGGLVSNGMLVPYSVSKAAVVALSENLDVQLKESKIPIGITVLCPGPVRTRINDAERNRPVELIDEFEQPKTEKQKHIEDIFANLNEQGMAPQEYASLVFDAIRKNKLYLLSHPEYNEAIQQRAEAVLQAIQSKD
jgi:NAD(P)-dependent dehydrogenase (short-subunit alcohol dehydrogenase family)